MKILWIAPYPYNDGKKLHHPAPWIQMLSSGLAKEPNIELTILCTSSNIKAEIEKTDVEGIKLIYVKHKNSIFTNELQLFKPRINKIKSYVEQHQDEFDLIHLHGSEHQYHTSVKNIDIPKVLSVQGILHEYAKVVPDKLSVKYLTMKIGGTYEENDLKYIKNFSCRTHWDANYIKRVSPESKIYNIWEMIRPSFFSDHFSLEKKKILFIGGTQMLKGYKQMLIAFNKIKAKANNMQLIIAGGTDKAKIDQAIKDFKLQNIKDGDIDFKGFLNEEGIINAYKEAYCFVHPTYIDNSPNSVCEAQLSGLPTIASNVGGVSSLITHRETGLLTDLNPENITNSVIELLEDDMLRSKISENSRKIARERHNPDKILKDNITMYQSIT